MIEITRDEAESFVDLVEVYLLDIIRSNPDIDSIEWLGNLLEIYRKCQAALKEENHVNPG